MRAFNAVPKPVLVLELLGMVLLALAYLSINHIISLPSPFDSATAAIVMVFCGIALMLPAAMMILWAVAHNVAPLLTKPQGESHSRKDKRDDADD
ncbi:DUF1418 family protein [Enterobacteriaceae bacterium 4M9]|nr:DUF1418 family protein [Enterobacteriaceae bacterium 4M9]